MTEENPSDKRKPGRKIRIELRRNRAKPRRRGTDWSKGAASNEAAHDFDTTESVRGKGDLSRKRTIIVGEPDTSGDLRDGTVTAVRGLICEVDDGETTWGCTVRRLLRTRLIEDRHPITVGDRVRFAPVMAGSEVSTAVSESLSLPEGVIEDVAPRRSQLERQYDRREQVVAANIDDVIIVVAADQPPLRPHLIDRYLMAIHHGDMRPVICINKADLDETGYAAEVAERYRGVGYKAILSSVPDSRGMEELKELIRNRNSVVVGPSGAGKSSLINALAPGLKLKTGDLTDLARGRHTTTTAVLLRWPFGGYVVDTPGMRQFDPKTISPEELEAYWPEFREFIPQCPFPDCSHTHEEGCALKEAVEAGAISLERYESYCKMHQECEEKPKY